VEKQEQGQG
jgi:hypothetical protein